MKRETVPSAFCLQKSRLIKEVRSVDPVEGQAMSFTLVYNEKGGETSTYVFSTNTEEEAGRSAIVPSESIWH